MSPFPHPSRPCFASSGSANHLAIAASLRSGPAALPLGCGEPGETGRLLGRANDIKTGICRDFKAMIRAI